MTKLGFIGLGLIGAKRAKIAQSLGYPIAFMVDPDPKRLAALPAEDCCRATSLAEVEAKGADRVDAVFIAVPHDLALQNCTWAFDRGAHVLCEKPMGLNLDQAREIAAAAKKADRMFGSGFNYRYLPGVDALRNLIREGKLGTPFRVRMMIGHGGRPGMEQEWKVKRARAGGGAIIDPGIHLVDLARHLFGADTTVYSSMHRRFWPTDVEDNCTLQLRDAADSVDVSIEVSLTSWKNQFAIEAYGSEGMAVLTGRGANYGSQRIEYVNRWFWKDTDNRFVRDLGVEDPSFELETRAFLEKITSGKEDGILSGPEDGRGALAVVGQAYECGRSLTGAT